MILGVLMFISPETMFRLWRISPNGVLHVGAHLGEEKLEYERYGFGKIYWVEANPILCDRLKKVTSDEVFQGLVWSTSNLDRKFHVGEDTFVSSTLSPGLINEIYPSLVFTKELNMKTTTLQDLIPPTCNYNFVNFDVQGAELHAMKGLGTLMDKVQYIYTEVNFVNLYKDSALLSDLDSFLKDYGFKRVALKRVPGKGWGEAFFIRTSNLGQSKNLRLSIGSIIFKFINFFSMARDFLNRAIGFIRVRLK
jgi:FkbM family methyltransferase